MTYPIDARRLPEPEPRRDAETAVLYGGRILAFVISTGVTATVPLPALELANHAAPAVLQGLTLDETAFANVISRARREILDAIARREAIDAEVERAQHDGRAESPDDGQRGHGARLQPAPIVHPPAGRAVDPRPAPQPIVF